MNTEVNHVGGQNSVKELPVLLMECSMLPKACRVGGVSTELGWQRVPDNSERENLLKETCLRNVNLSSSGLHS